MIALFVVSIAMIVVVFLCMKKMTCSCCGENVKILPNKSTGIILIVYAILFICIDFFLISNEISISGLFCLLLGTWYFFKKEDSKCLACRIQFK